MFVLHERLAADTMAVTELGLCTVRLMNDRSFPWLILVPMRPDVREIHQLAPADRRLLIEEVAAAGQIAERLFGPDKLNLGALGNIVPQLHLHVVARRRGDRAWPGPVWGSGQAVPYDDAEAAALIARLRQALAA